MIVDSGVHAWGEKTIKGLSKFHGSGIRITNKVLKDVIKQNNRGILLRETTKKITRAEGGFLNFLKSLILAGLPFMKNVLTPFTKSVLFPLAFATAATDLTIQKTIFGSEAILIIPMKKWKIL